jgi:hypothetical protein
VAHVFDEQPVAAVLGLPAGAVQLERPEALGGQHRLIHLDLPAAGHPVGPVQHPGLGDLMLRIEVLEVDAERLLAVVERHAQPLGLEGRAPRRRLSVQIPDAHGSSPQPGQPLFEGFYDQVSDPVVNHGRVAQTVCRTRRLVNAPARAVAPGGSRRPLLARPPCC